MPRFSVSLPGQNSCPYETPFYDIIRLCAFSSLPQVVGFCCVGPDYQGKDGHDSADTYIKCFTKIHVNALSKYKSELHFLRYLLHTKKVNFTGHCSPLLKIPVKNFRQLTRFDTHINCLFGKVKYSLIWFRFISDCEIKLLPQHIWLYKIYHWNWMKTGENKVVILRSCHFIEYLYNVLLHYWLLSLFAPISSCTKFIPRSIQGILTFSQNVQP